MVVVGQRVVGLDRGQHADREIALAHDGPDEGGDRARRDPGAVTKQRWLSSQSHSPPHDRLRLSALHGCLVELVAELVGRTVERGTEISSFGGRHMDVAAGEVQLEFDNVAIVIVVEHDLGTMRPGGEFGYAGDKIHSPVSQAVVDIAVSRGHDDLHGAWYPCLANDKHEGGTQLYRNVGRVGCGADPRLSELVQRLAWLAHRTCLGQTE